VSERIRRHLEKLEALAYPRSWLEMLDAIGSGEFGRVMRAETTDGGRNPSRFVAVKILKDHPTEKEREDFLSEGELLSRFTHDNVLKLFGCCTDSEPYMLVIEYCPHGDLRSFLRAVVGVPAMEVTYAEQIKMCMEVACGMEYLSGKGLIHRDLAARNCLVGQNSIIKVADFGLSRKLQDEDDYYIVQSKGKLPVRWMAIESLEFRKFSMKTDVWSFGVAMWEIFTFGTTRPYRKIDVKDLIYELRSGKRLHAPRGCPSEMATLMSKCWDKDARLRPDFTSLRITLHQWLLREMSRGASPRELGQTLDELTASMV
jgi:serine/threonine protein kinase